MDAFHGLFYGLSIALQPGNLLFCLIGVSLGTLIGVLPGIGPVGTISILLPVTFRMPPVSATIMLAGIYYGCMYGGSTTSILVNIPGEAASVVTCLDGYEMAKRGRAGSALGIAAFGSFIAGTLGTLGVMLFAPPLAALGLEFGPPEYFSLIFLALTLITYLSRGPFLKTVMMGSFGLILSCIGLDQTTASPRLSLNIIELWDGISLAPLAMGLFGISEILANIDQTDAPEILKTKIINLFPSLADWMQAKWAILRGSILGFFIGILPGPAGIISSFASYGLEKRISKTPENFGRGAIEGVAGPESANNSATSGSLIPLFTLGIPPNSIMALLFGALMIHGISPGPLLIREHPDLFWGVIGSMYIGNVMLLILNLPLIPLWVQVLKVPYRILFPLILLFCLIGSYGLRNSFFDVLVMIIAGVMGYIFRRFRYECAPLVLAFVIGPVFEQSLRQSLRFSEGSFLIFFTRPISAITLVFAIILFARSFISYFLKGTRKS